MSEKNCFVIAPIGDPGSPTRKRSDQVLKYIIKPSVMECGYSEPLRADNMDNPGIITSQVIQRITVCSLVVADLSERNPNVFYELAIRHAIRKPLVQMMGRGEVIPFDVSPMRTIMFDIHDLDDVEKAKAEMIGQINNLSQHPEDFDTPISQAIDLKSLSESKKPEEQLIAQIVPLLGHLKRSIDEVRLNMSRPALPVVFPPGSEINWNPSGATQYVSVTPTAPAATDGNPFVLDLTPKDRGATD
jgi:hypothetical protein